MHTSFMIIALLPALLFAQTGGEQDVWAPLRFFVGKWEGTTAGTSSIGTATREYEFIFDGTFLQSSDKHIYESSTTLPEGDVHEDLGLFSYDRIRKTLVLRQFHGEGFVSQYALDSLSADGTTIIFVAEGIENIPPGWRAKEQYEILGKDEFVEFFKLAPPDKEFEVYSETRFTRAQ